MNRFSVLSARFALALAVCGWAGASAQAQYNGYPYWASAPSSYQGPSPITVPGGNLRVWSDPLYATPAHGSMSPLFGGYGIYSFTPEYSATLPGAGYRMRQDNSAHIVLDVPANAEVWFNGNKTKQTGQVRHFYSPQLEPGKNYVYSLRVRWTKDGKENEENRRVRVHANATVPVNLMK